MKKTIAIIFVILSICSPIIAEEYPNSWKMDILCKQGNHEYYIATFVVSVENKEFSFGPYDNNNWKKIKFNGSISDGEIKISNTYQDKGSKSHKFYGKFKNDNEAIIKGGNEHRKCKGRFYKVDRPPHFTPLKYLSEATEEIIKFTSYNPGIALSIINGTYTNSPVEVSGKLTLPKEGSNLPVVVFAHGSGGPSTNPFKSYKRNFKNQLLKNNIGFFELDYFTGRGVKSTGSNQSKVSMNAGELDALVLYKVLDKHPRVNAKKLGITGESRGGIAAYLASEKKFSDVIIGEENYYSASLPLYPDCFLTGFENPTPTPTKILFILGEKDDYTLASHCIRYAEKMKQAGGDVEVIVKKGWHHSFNSDKPISKSSTSVIFNKCAIHFPDGFQLDDTGFWSNSIKDKLNEILKIDLDKLREKFIEASEKPEASNKLMRKTYKKLWKKCGSKGPTTGGDHAKETLEIAVPFFVNALK